MLRYRGRKRVTQRNSVEGNRQRENEIVQGALQGEHREEILRRAKEKNKNNKTIGPKLQIENTSLKKGDEGALRLDPSESHPSFGRHSF